MQRKFSHAFHVPGQLSANLNIRFTVPSGCQLVHVSAVQSDADAAAITIGTSADPDGWLEATSIGVSNTPNEFDLDDFDGALLTSEGNEYPVAVDGTIVLVAIDYDYNAGQGSGAASDVTIVLTFAEGGV